MKLLYFDCPMGAAGDMLMSALLDIHPNPQKFIDKMNSMGLEGVSFIREKAKSSGIAGTHVKVTVNGTVEDCAPPHHHSHATSSALGEHHHEHTHHHEHNHSHHEHRSLDDIDKIINKLDISDKVKNDASSVYRIIAEAESAMHGETVVDIHFHEVGRLDAIADIVGVCSLIEELDPNKIISSPICVGFGTVHAAHGILPVPAPATALILKDVPIYSGTVQGELCTPTGAALLKYFADDFEQMPQIVIQNTGYGIGTKQFAEAPNCVRAVIGESGTDAQNISELCCNLDDMTPEDIGYASQKLFEAGALDVFTVPIGMKKNRPGILLSCLCKLSDRSKMLELIFKHTSTIGIREYKCERYTLDRREEIIKTEHGDITQKISTGYGVSKTKPEYDDIVKIANKLNISLSEARKLI